MNLAELYTLLRERKLGEVSLRNELSKIYGVTRMPQQQANARKEAIKILENYDRLKKGQAAIAISIAPVILALIQLIVELAKVK